MISLEDDRLLIEYQTRAPEGFRPLSLRRLRWVQDCAELRYQHRDGRVHTMLVHVRDGSVLGTDER